MFGKNAVTQLSEPEGSFLLDLTLFPSGPLSVLDRIPENIAGVYSWFRAYHYSDDPEILYEQVMKAVLAPKFLTRSGMIKPFYEVTIGAKSWFSDNKKTQLKQALLDPIFRRGLLDTLRCSILFQSPLYIGKSTDIKRRVSSHLKDGSHLRERLKTAMVDVEQTLLLIVPNIILEEDDITKSNHVVSDDKEDQSLNGELDFDAYEILYEEIFSRLFNPSFTIRLG